MPSHQEQMAAHCRNWLCFWPGKGRIRFHYRNSQSWCSQDRLLCFAIYRPMHRPRNSSKTVSTALKTLFPNDLMDADLQQKESFFRKKDSSENGELRTQCTTCMHPLEHWGMLHTRWMASRAFQQCAHFIIIITRFSCQKQGVSADKLQ